jgi:RNase P/RNase MRP subunit p29
MSTQIQRRRGTTSEHSSFTGAAGEITIDSTKNTVVVHDGSTQGGIPLAKESALASSVGALTDVTITSVGAGEILKYSGSEWVNNTLAEAGIQAYDADTAKLDATTANFTGTLQNGGSNVVVDSDIGSTVQAYDANLTSFVTALTLPTADGSAGQFLKTNGSGTVSFASIPTINTLNDIGNVTISSAAAGQFLKWSGSAWVNATVEAFDTQTHTTTATSQVSIAEYAKATYDGVKAVVTADDGTNRSIAEILITHNGTTAIATEYAQLNTSTALATFDVDISGSDIRILATPAAATSTAFTVKAITL